MSTKILTRLCLFAILTSGQVSASLIDGDEPCPSANGKATVAGQHKYTDKEISEMQEHARESVHPSIVADVVQALEQRKNSPAVPAASSHNVITYSCAE